MYFFVNLVININTKRLVVIDPGHKKAARTPRLPISFCPDEVYSSCSLADPRSPGVDASHTSTTTSMSQSFSTFNFVDVKNIEVSLARSTPSNTCQSQSIALSAAAEDSPVILSVRASSSRWKHLQHTQLPAVGEALIPGAQSEGEQQLL